MTSCAIFNHIHVSMCDSVGKEEWCTKWYYKLLNFDSFDSYTNGLCEFVIKYFFLISRAMMSFGNFSDN